MEFQQFICTIISGILLLNSDCPVSATSYAAFPFRSSDKNAAIASREYENSPIELYVATAFGDEIPFMRDDLIARKNNGEGFIARHMHAWKTLRNWKVDPTYDWKEINT